MVPFIFSYFFFLISKEIHASQKKLDNKQSIESKNEISLMWLYILFPRGKQCCQFDVSPSRTMGAHSFFVSVWSLHSPCGLSATHPAVSSRALITTGHTPWMFLNCTLALCFRFFSGWVFCVQRHFTLRWPLVLTRQRQSKPWVSPLRISIPVTSQTCWLRRLLYWIESQPGLHFASQSPSLTQGYFHPERESVFSFLSPL